MTKPCKSNWDDPPGRPQPLEAEEFKSPAPSDLHNMGLKYRTDKSYLHNFLHFYEPYLSAYRNAKINLLEIGILQGASLKMWAEYFPRGSITGGDIHDKSHLDNERIQTLTFDQENENDLRNILDQFDIIIDDGGHSMKQQQLTLKVLFRNNLKAAGIYIIEDLHTSFSLQHGSTSTNNTINLIEDLQTGATRPQADYYINNNIFQELHEYIIYSEIYRSRCGYGLYLNGCRSITCILKKK